MCEMNTRPGFRRVFRVMLTGLIVITLSACTNQPDDDGIMDDTVGMPMDTVGGMTGEMGHMDGMHMDTVEVSLVEYDIDMPTTLPPGHTVFRVTNEGTMEHNFEVEGQGREEMFPQNLQPGEMQTMDVDLQAGTYVVYCPVGDHQSRGMQMSLTVAASGMSENGGVMP